MLKIMLTDKFGEKELFEFEDMDKIEVLTTEATVDIVGHSVAVAIEAESLGRLDSSEVSLTFRDNKLKHLTSATLYTTPNGRIMGRNSTPGFAALLKPLATTPSITE